VHHVHRPKLTSRMSAIARRAPRGNRRRVALSHEQRRNVGKRCAAATSETETEGVLAKANTVVTGETPNKARSPKCHFN
jgi:hypothetical protein